MTRHEQLAESVENLGRYRMWAARRIGAYAFFAVNGFALATLAQALAAHATGLPVDGWLIDLTGTGIWVTTFLALRDMTRSPFDIVAREARLVAKSEGAA